jgi:hypothetical protein
MLSALAQGYNASQIVGWLSNNNKKLARTIKSALSQGYTQDDILKYLTKGKYATHGQRNQMLSGQTEQEKGTRIFNQGTDWKGLAKNIGTGVALAGGAYGAVRGLPAIAQGIQSASGLLNRPTDQPPTPQPDIPPIQEAAQLPTDIQQPPEQPATTQDPQKSIEILSNMGVISPVRGMIRSGTSPEDIESVLDQHFLKPGQKKWLDEQIKSGQAKPLAEMVRDVFSLQREQPKESAPVQEPPIEDIEEEEEEVFEKGNAVVTPTGDLGDLQANRNGKAIVSENGKLKQVEASQVIPSPLPKKDLAELYEDLIKGIEEEIGGDVSRNVNWAGYDPELNQLAYLPHDGSLYIYNNITPEDVEMLTNILAKRKTTGNSLVGSWVKGTSSPIGHEMSNLVKRLQSERGRGKEYSGKYQPVYFSLDAAYEAKNIKLQQQRMDAKAEKNRIKEEKDAEKRKKRKKT